MNRRVSLQYNNGIKLGYARVSTAELVLLCVAAIPFDRGETVISPNFHELMASEKETQAISYLHQLLERVSNDRLQIKTITSSGRSAATIIGHAERLNVDLIGMTDRGQSGIRKRIFGNVAEKVLFGAACATMVVREQVPVHKEDLVLMKGV